MIEQMPFDRERTSMRRFPMCQACATSYDHAADRRFHAEGSSCAACGPRIWWTDRRGNEGDADWRAVVRSALLAGQIAAIRGVGGYQLLCDATSRSAIERLRLRKRRPLKPLAVLVRDLCVARRVAKLEDAEESALLDSINPIVIVQARKPSELASKFIHPGIDQIGILLPTSFLHYLILDDAGRPLVCTSGNKDGEAIEVAPEHSMKRLADVADVWVHHDRDIVHSIDDSVVRVMAGRRMTIRLARGLAPYPLPFGERSDGVLAAGGQMKSAIAWHNGRQACLGPYLGDLDSVSVADRFTETIEQYGRLYRSRPVIVAVDKHPDYLSRRMVSDGSAELVSVQHHHSHVVASAIEAGLLDREVLGVSWDGTGLGDDDMIWGGEFLRASPLGFERVASLRPFPLPGGERAIEEPWRIALAMMLESDSIPRSSITERFDERTIDRLRSLIQQRSVTPWTSSIGRLFDAVSWILLGDEITGFDGRAAMVLESVADRSETADLPFPLIEVSPVPRFDWGPLVSAVINGRRAGLRRSALAGRFHRTLARAIIHVSDRMPGFPVLLSGGVFQNRVLVEMISEEWNDRPGRPELVTPGMIPCNDGGLAAGQLVVALSTVASRNQSQEGLRCV
jgi:hydrogenase maturation protein HypF